MEQLASKFADFETQLSQTRERAARAEHELLMTRELMERTNQGQARPEAPPAEDIPEITDEEFLANPGKAFTKALRSMRDVSKAEREQAERKQYVERAKELFETGRKTAIPAAGKLTQGIEDVVAQEIQTGIINGVIDPTAATDPDLWAVTALAYRYKALGERNFDKYLGSVAPQGMSPAYTERPTPGPPPKAGPTLTPEEEELISRGNITREAYLASKERIRQTAQERAR